MFLPNKPNMVEYGEVVEEIGRALTELENWTGLDWICHRQRPFDGEITIGNKLYPERMYTTFYLYSKVRNSDQVVEMYCENEILSTIYTMALGLNNGFRVGYHACCGFEEKEYNR